LAIVGLLTAVITNLDRVKDLWQTVHSPSPPPITGTWQHYASKNPHDLESLLNLSEVDPKKVAANCTLGGNIHIWYLPKTGNGHFVYREFPWTGDSTPLTVNYFYNDGKTIPIGWWRNPTTKFSYFEATP